MDNNGQSERLAHLGAVVEEHQDQLFRYAFFRTGSMAEAQDVVQDVLLKLFADGMEAVGPGKIRAYLFRSIHNACIDHHRRIGRTRTTPLDHVAHQRSADSEDTALYEEYRRVSRLMEGLPREQSEIIRMKTVNDMSFHEIAESLGLPLATVKSRFRYGVQKLRSKIGK